MAGVSTHSSPPRIGDPSDLDLLMNGRTAAPRHRPKISDRMSGLPFNVLVHRLVSRKEYLENGKAMNAYWREWNNLEARYTWDWNSLKGWKTVSREARARNEEAHLGYHFRHHGRKKAMSSQ